MGDIVSPGAPVRPKLPSDFSRVSFRSKLVRKLLGVSFAIKKLAKKPLSRRRGGISPPNLIKGTVMYTKDLIGIGHLDNKKGRGG